eukprot:7376247-Alexandrium_andersonii.AAC.1
MGVLQQVRPLNGDLRCTARQIRGADGCPRDTHGRAQSTDTCRATGGRLPVVEQRGFADGRRPAHRP